MLDILKYSLNTLTLKRSIRQNIFSFTSLNRNFNRIGFKYHSNSKGFSEKVKLKDRIKLIDYEEMEIEKEQWGELLSASVEKENLTKFHEQINYIKQKKIPLTTQEINKILQIIYTKYPKEVDLLHDWIDDNNLQMDSITYHFLIMSSIKFKGFNSAFNLFFRAHLFNIPQNLSVIIALCKELSNLKNTSEKMKYKNFIQIHVRKYYSTEVTKLLSSFNIEFDKHEELLNEESVKLEELFRKSLKPKKNYDERKTYSERNSVKGSNSSGRKKNNSLKNNKENNVETRDTSSKNKDESGNSIDKPSNTNDTEKEKNEISKLNELSETVIHTDIKLPEELANNKDTDSVSHESTENKKAKKKSKERKNRKDYDNTLDNIFGNGGIIVIAQSLQNPEDSDSSDSE